MRLDVVVHEPADFDAWAEEASAPRGTPTDEALFRGWETFMSSSCVYCHAIEGTPASSEFGPDLTNLADRARLAAGVVPNNRGHLAGWILDPQRIKPGNHMPATWMEPQRLNELLDAKSRYQAVDPVYARVIARAPGAWFDVFTVNRGTLDGVDTNMAVITGDGLVGHVFEVGLNYAKVRTIIDARSAVAGLIERTRYNGVMRGQLGADSENPRLHMYYMASTSDVRPGDRVLTSGEDELFPKGIPVGTVQEVSRRSDEADQYVVVAPLADFTRLEEVLVLRQLAEAADNQPLPRLPDPTPRPLPSASPSPEGSLAPGEVTPTPVPSGDLWSFPTVMPTSDMPPEIGGATQAPAPSTTP